MNQEGEGHGTLKEVPKLAGKSLESVRSKDIKVPPPPPEDQSISRLVKDVKQSQDEVQRIRKDQEETCKLHAEQLEQQKRLVELMVQMQDTISAKKVGNSTKALLVNGNSSKMSVLGICHREVCSSPSLNDVDGDELEEANMEDTPSQFDQREEEEEFEDNEEFTFGKTALKKVKPLPAQLQYWSEAREFRNQYHKDACKKVLTIKLVTLYTGDIDVKPFQSHLEDPELADLKDSDKLAAGKHMKQQEGLFGVFGSIGTYLMVELEDLLRSVNAATISFNLGEIDGKKIDDPFAEGARFALDIKNVLTKRMAPAVKNLVRLTAAGYSKNVLARRELYQFMVRKEKGARERLKRLQPAENKLFGGKVPGLTKALRDGDQVIIYLLFLPIC